MVMKNRIWAMVAGIAWLLVNSGYVLAGAPNTDFAAVTNIKYAKECGACHLAYQPGLLPERSWRKVMENLHDHFGDNAELPTADQPVLLEYLVNNSAERANYKRSAQMLHSIRKVDTPVRISQVPYFIREHREVANRVRGNEKIKSLGQCELCHQKANEGSYAENEIRVLGAESWND